ncbi:hypothetical protein [Vitiosangium sp. GDMCC 1.1324]|uniref:hypothetical protein n=1 Tax=Vitiosangium sp. (strain GDMCC 1.1324) TaxID=2138576 RepID=UPI000D39C54A|nr:hypothetical protein [Vitiosangium sp. GDMCC 1.1324]PTL74916.1 hypothetical protein DAT35_57755 [Vitiosangium sp. GDMCC 1.1324]
MGLELNGIDSTIRAAFVRAPDGSLSRLWYDSDSSGGGAECAAIVSRRPCAALRSAPEEPSLLTCEWEGEGRRICDEAYSPARNWGPPQDASSLECETYWGDRWVCEQREGQPGNVPAGTTLRCMTHPSRLLVCVKGGTEP